MNVLNIDAIEAAFRKLKMDFPELNRSLAECRDQFDDEVAGNMLAGYEMVDQLLSDGVDILAKGQLHHWLKLNAIVLCGPDGLAHPDNRSFIAATESHFYEQCGGGINDVMDWCAYNESKNVWRRASGVFIRILSEPQLFIEGNHRTGALIMSYLLAREGRPPFVLTNKNARAFFTPASVFKKSRKHHFMTRLKMPRLTNGFADFLRDQGKNRFLAGP